MIIFKENFILREPKATPEYETWNKEKFFKNRKLEKLNLFKKEKNG